VAIARPRGLGASGEQLDHVTVQADEHVRSREVAILPYIFFPAGSAEIPASYRTSTAPAGNGDALSSYPAMLAVVGRRMAENPSERITLIGTNSNTGAEQGNLDLSRARAAAVRDFLIANFGIDSSRIVMQARGLPAHPSNSSYPQGEEENRRVEIVAGPALLAPLTLGDTVVRTSSPGFRVQSDVNAAAGLADWTIEVRMDNSVIRRLNGKQILTHQVDDTFTDDELHRLLGASRLEARISVSDSTGQKLSTQWQSIPVEVQRTVQQDLMLADTSLMLQDMILFDYNSSELSAGTRAALTRLKSRLPQGARLSVIGYADETGDREYNRKLSLARARAVAEALGTGVASVEGAGGTTSIYPNDTPAGRFYSRSVRVVVQKPGV
jgi:outer membrane protein OmpA-like peptidoglycan-associated protein